MTKPVTIELPDPLARDAGEIANASGETLQAFVARAVSREVERERTDAFFAERRARANAADALAILNRDGGEAPAFNDALPEGYSSR